MKKLILVLISYLFVSQFLLAQNPTEEQASPPPADKNTGEVVIKKPENTVDKYEIFPATPLKIEFIGGHPTLLKFIYDNLNYPKIAKRKRVQGTVLIKFVIDKNFYINGAEIIQDIGAGCGAEALRVVNLMPRWQSASSRGRTEKWQFILPVEFKLKNWKPLRPKEIILSSKLIDAKHYYKFFTENKDYKFVTYPPFFHGCDSIGDYADRDYCTEEKLQQFIKTNLEYPEKARQKKIEGIVYVSFSIEEDGSIANPKLMNDIGAGCGEEALRLVSLMPIWNPSKQNGKPTRYRYELPIVFSLK